MTDIGTLGGTYAWAYAIDNAGQVVGDSSTATGAVHAFLYTSAGGMADTGTLGGTSIAYAINQSGHVVGSSVLNNGSTDAFLYSKGVMIDLNAPAGEFGVEPGPRMGNQRLRPDRRRRDLQWHR